MSDTIVTYARRDKGLLHDVHFFMILLSGTVPALPGFASTNAFHNKEELISASSMPGLLVIFINVIHSVGMPIAELRIFPPLAEAMAVFARRICLGRHFASFSIWSIVFRRLLF